MVVDMGKNSGARERKRGGFPSAHRSWWLPLAPVTASVVMNDCTYYCAPIERQYKSGGRDTKRGKRIASG